MKQNKIQKIIQDGNKKVDDKDNYTKESICLLSIIGIYVAITIKLFSVILYY